MEKTILIAGKDLPDGHDFAEGALMTGRNVVTAASDSTKIKQAAAGQVVTALWNTMSPVSARSVVLECENNFRRIDEAVLIFDEASFAEKYDGMSIENCTRGVDEMIIGYQYLVQEILARFEKRYAMDYSQTESPKPAKLVFMLKSSPSEADILKNPALRNTVTCAAGPFVAAAANAFAALGENISAMYGGRDYVNVLLVKSEQSMELAKSDRNLSGWLCGYLDEVDELKHKLTAKQSAAWVKPGAKNPGGVFPFLK